MWKRDALFIGLCLVGLGALSANLLSNHRIEDPADYNPQANQEDDFTAIVEQVNSEFRMSWERDDEPLEVAARATELTIARRLSLGLTGTVPSLEEIRAFESQPEGTRLTWWVARLLNDQRYSDYFAERLARAYVGTENGPFLVYRRRRFVTWLAEQLKDNVRYNRIVHSLISDSGLWTDSPSVNFLTVTMEQNQGRPDPVRLAGRTSRAFLGMRIDCLQCHDDNLGTIDLGVPGEPREGLQTDFHSLAAFFSEPAININGLKDRNPKPYAYKLLGDEDETELEPQVPFLNDLLDGEGTRRERLARWVTHPENRPFARAAVNRVWALMFSRPLVDPVDDIPLLSSDFPPGLESLAQDFADNEFDLHRLIRVIAALDVFQLDSRSDDFEITGRHERKWAAFPLSRLRPEQVAGSLIQACKLTTIDANAHIVTRLTMFGQQNDFVKRYGDMGEDEFEDRGGTVIQRLLMLNGKLVKERTKPEPLLNAATRISILAPTDEVAIETTYLATYTRRPTPQESAAFIEIIRDKEGQQRHQALEDIYWTLLNSTEFSWNH